MTDSGDRKGDDRKGDEKGADKKRHDRVEITTAVVLSVAGLFTAWAGYQSALWDGQQAANYARAGALRTTATRETLQANVRQAVQVGMFNNWLQAKARDETALAEFFRTRFLPDFRPAFETWLAMEPLKNPAAPPTPFSVAGYEPKGLANARALESQADQVYKEGQRDNEISDDYVRATVLMATALFFGGICQVFHLRVGRLLLLTVAVLACAAGLFQVFSLPTLKPG